MKQPSLRDRQAEAFKAALRRLTSAQVQDTYDREFKAGRRAYARLAAAEAAQRGITLDSSVPMRVTGAA